MFVEVGGLMAKSDGHFEEFKPHSKHKHLIFKHYFEAWGHKLGLRKGSNDQILYVDACAGRGKDDLGNDGSPLIGSKSAAVATESVRRQKSGLFRIKVLAIEKKRKHFEVLKALLAPFGEDVRAIKGTLGDTIAEIEQEFGDTPTLFFIDPFGLEPLDANVVKRALSGDRNEVLILFADQAALRHFGAVATSETKAEIRHKSSFSVAKSFLSAVLGKALEKGIISSLDDPVSKYLPELTNDPDFKGLTLRHLMNMQSGFAYERTNGSLWHDLRRKRAVVKRVGHCFLHRNIPMLRLRRVDERVSMYSVFDHNWNWQ
jgi:three-Cys-motif partner protein